MIAAAREGLKRSKWTVGDPDDELLAPICGALAVHFAKELRLDRDQEPIDEQGVRDKVGAELRAAAQRHPPGTARHSTFLEAARLAARGQST
jgi:hypothetical protein